MGRLMKYTIHEATVYMDIKTTPKRNIRRADVASRPTGTTCEGLPGGGGGGGESRVPYYE